MCQVLRTQWRAKQILPSLLEHHFRSLEYQGHLPLIGCFYYMIPFSCHFAYISFLRVTELICIIISSTAANCYCFVWPIILPFGELVCSVPCKSSRAINQGASIPYPVIDIWLRRISIPHSPGCRDCSRLDMWSKLGQLESFCRE